MTRLLKFPIRIIGVAFVLSIPAALHAQSSLEHFHFSVLPNIQTDSSSSSNISINLLAGYVRDVRGIELGGILNFDRNTLSGFQGAGIGNIVGNSVSGIQYAGIFNTAGSVTGIQDAGIINKSNGKVEGMQMAGIANICTKELKGAQFSGITNIINGNILGAQFSGIFNKTDSITGLQCAGIINQSEQINGTQIAGIVNLSDNVKGLQLSGILNKTKILKGVQLGLINIADSSNGISIGLINIIKHSGYYKFELSGNELGFVNSTFRMGTRKFHTNFSAGIRPKQLDNSPVWNYQLGIGTSFALASKTMLDIDLSNMKIMKGNYCPDYDALYKAEVDIEHQISPKFSIVVAGSCNLFLSDTQRTNYNTFSDLIPYTLYNHTNAHGKNIKGWIGGKIGFRLF
jgi:hypothetical protein